MVNNTQETIEELPTDEEVINAVKSLRSAKMPKYYEEDLQEALQKQRESIVEMLSKRIDVLDELIGKFNLDIDKHRKDEIIQTINNLNKE